MSSWDDYDEKIMRKCVEIATNWQTRYRRIKLKPGVNIRLYHLALRSNERINDIDISIDDDDYDKLPLIDIVQLIKGVRVDVLGLNFSRAIRHWNDATQMARALGNHPTLKTVIFDDLPSKNLLLKLIEVLSTTNRNLSRIEIPMKACDCPELQTLVFALPVAALELTDGEVNLRAVYETLQHNTRLTSISLDNYNLVGDGLTGPLQNNTTLTYIKAHYIDNKSSAGQGSQFLNLMKHSPNLTHADIPGLVVESKEDAQQLVDILNHTRNLTYLSGWIKHEECKDAILCAIRDNSTLTSLMGFSTFDWSLKDGYSFDWSLKAGYMERNKENKIKREISLYELLIPLVFKNDAEDKYKEMIKRQRCI